MPDPTPPLLDYAPPPKSLPIAKRVFLNLYGFILTPVLILGIWFDTDIVRLPLTPPIGLRYDYGFFPYLQITHFSTTPPFSSHHFLMRGLILDILLSLALLITAELFTRPLRRKK